MALRNLAAENKDARRGPKQEVIPDDKTTPRCGTRPILSFVLLAACSPASAELEINGIDGDPAANIRLFAPLANEPCNAEEWRLRRRYGTLEADAKKALEPFGYYSPELASTFTRNDDCWTATLDVSPGERVRLRNVDVQIGGDAETDPVIDGVVGAAGLRTGDALRHADYEQLKRNLQIAAADRGYVEAAFAESRIDVWPDDLAADINIDFQSGPRYVLGDVTIEQDFLDPDLVAGFLDLAPGAPFDRADLSRAYTDLSNSGYFGRIRITPDFDNASEGRIPIMASMDRGTRLEYSIGAGASTDTGPRLRAGFRQNRLNRAGHRLKADLNLSTVVQVLSGEYRQPLTDPRVEWMSYTGSISREVTDTFEDDKAALGLRRTKRLSSRWMRTLGLDLSYDRFVVADEREETFLVVPSVTFDHKVADRELYPDRGRRFTVEFAGSDEAIGSSASFLQVTAWLRLVRSLGDNTRVIARGQAGSIESGDFASLPPSIRYFAGGDQSVRGYDFQSLGPTNDDGEVIGGTRLLVGSLELERRLRGNFFGAVFVDAGNAFSDSSFDPAVGAGVGIKWRSPVGPVRLYVGFPIDEDDANPRLHLRLGAEL